MIYTVNDVIEVVTFFFFLFFFFVPPPPRVFSVAVLSVISPVAPPNNGIIEFSG